MSAAGGWIDLDQFTAGLREDDWRAETAARMNIFYRRYLLDDGSVSQRQDWSRRRFTHDEGWERGHGYD